jgi:predicted transcriptional regulator
MEATKSTLIELTAQIVSAFVANNVVSQEGLAALLAEVSNALRAGPSGTTAKPEEQPRTPAVPIKKSVTPDFIVCLEDGRKFKSLKRHLRTAYNLTPAEYRQRWGLPTDYPMVAPNYAETRSRLAKEVGLGLRRKGEIEAPQDDRSEAA